MSKISNTHTSLKNRISRYTFIILVLILYGFITASLRAQTTLLPDTTLVCNNDSALLDAGPGFINYFWWETGEQTQTIWVTLPGLYHVSCDTAELQAPIIDSTFVIFQHAGIVQNDTLTCYKYSLELCAEPDTLKYFWTSSDPDYNIANNTAACIEVMPELDTTTFYVSITDSLNTITCIDSVTVWLYPRMRFEEVTQINTGCPGTCKGQLEVIVSGGKPPYSYLWFTSPEQYDSIAFGLCEQDYTFRVFDEFICIRDTVIPVEVYDMPEVEIISDPDTSGIYIKNPLVTFSFDNLSIDSIQIIDWNWNFGDSTYSVDEAPVKVFEDVRNYEVWLKYTTNDECIDSVMLNIEVKPVKLNIPNIITPNGDGFNDLFVIEELEYYMSNKLAIFNRYGKRVFSQTDYQSDWDGENLRDGAYFYVLKADGYFGTDTYKGSLTILRGQ
jgi:gliding motility-associated-like protein